MLMNRQIRFFYFHDCESLGVSIVGIQQYIFVILSVSQQKWHMLKKIEEQNKTIQYIKKKYKQKTGEDVVMPLSWEDYLDMETNQTPAQTLPHFQDQQEEQKTFRSALDRYQLPTRINLTRAPLTSFTPNNKFHMVEIIDLSGYKDYGFSKQLLREFVSRVVEMRALNSVILKNNGIDDNCGEEIESLFGMKRICRLDLSSNKMGKTCLQIISKNFQHIEWIDLSRNYFLFDAHLLIGLLNSIRMNGKIWHVCLDLQDQKQVSTYCGFLKIKPQIHSFSLVDSAISKDSMEIICKALEDSATSGNKQIKQPTRITCLNFQNCYLKSAPLALLYKSLSINSTLISLNLNNNAIGQEMAINLCKIIQSNISIIKLQLSNNLLQDQFAIQLSKCLEKNQIIERVDISRNNIGEVGGQDILDCLSSKNDTLESLGSFQTNERMGQRVIQKIKKVLKINKVSKELRAKIVAQEGQLTAVEISNKQTQAYLDAEYKDFDLLVPIAVSNPLRDSYETVQIWDFEK